METVPTPISRPRVEAQEFVERRGRPRFGACTGLITALQLTVVGQTLNISRSGLVFQYVASKDQSADACRLSISLSDRSFNLDMMPFKRIWDVPVPEVFSHGSITSRYCAVEFGELLDFQVLALQFLIRNYTTPITETPSLRGHSRVTWEQAFV
jgi:hypothetical protein